MADEPAATATAPTDAPATTEPTTTITPPTPTSWRDRLSDGLKGEKTLERFKDESALAQSYLDLKRWQDGAIKLPGKDAKPEEVAAFREKLGVPKAPSDYKLDVPADMPEGTQIDPARFEHYAKFFHEHAFTNEQVQALAEWSAKEDQQRLARQTEQYSQELDKLATEWGAPVFDRRAANVQALVRRYAEPETVAWLNKSGLTNHPGLFKMLYPIAQQFAEDGIIEPTGDSTAGDISNVEQRINETRDKMIKAGEGTPEYRRLFDELDKLWKLRAEVAGAR